MTSFSQGDKAESVVLSTSVRWRLHARGESSRVVGLRQRVACLDCVRARGAIVIRALDRIVRSVVIAVQTTPSAGGPPAGRRRRRSHLPDFSHPAQRHEEQGNTTGSKAGGSAMPAPGNLRSNPTEPAHQRGPEDRC